VGLLVVARGHTVLDTVLDDAFAEVDDRVAVVDDNVHEALDLATVVERGE